MSKKEDLQIVYLLKVLQRNGDVSLLLRQGLSYVQIANLMDKMIEDGTLLEREDGIQVTEKGMSLLGYYESRLSFKKKVDWIAFLETEKFEPISLTEIYLPLESPYATKKRFKLSGKPTSPMTRNRRDGESSS